MFKKSQYRESVSSIMMFTHVFSAKAINFLLRGKTNILVGEEILYYLLDNPGAQACVKISSVVTSVKPIQLIVEIDFHLDKTEIKELSQDIWNVSEDSTIEVEAFKKSFRLKWQNNKFSFESENSKKEWTALLYVNNLISDEGGMNW